MGGAVSGHGRGHPSLLRCRALRALQRRRPRRSEGGSAGRGRLERRSGFVAAGRRRARRRPGLRRRAYSHDFFAMGSIAGLALPPWRISCAIGRRITCMGRERSPR
jgi:hypothetical protein